MKRRLSAIDVSLLQRIIFVHVGELAMPDRETAALLRTLLEELCASLAPTDVHTRTKVATSLLETVRQGEASLDELRAAGKQALLQPPTMWR
jgi:hypothetical protein